ncbi:MAG: hypothetical protein MMC33_010698 [Icmadophila ericetorum]|nr:hypothetical protein [Icmadophila ericetorum]
MTIPGISKAVPSTESIVDVEKDSENQLPRESTQEQQDTYFAGKKLYLTMMALMLAMFLVSLDRTIIATAIPHITDDFHSLNDLGWYGSAYLMTNCATQLSFGRIYTFYSSKTVFLTCIALFELGSVVCGAAPNSIAFIIGRAIAGMGSAGIQSGGIVLIAHILPLNKRPLYMGLAGAVFGVSSIAGPIIGGAFTSSRATWRWCFYINFPIGAVVFVILILILHFPRVERVSLRKQMVQLDPLGTLVFLPAIISLILALTWGGANYAWSSARIIALFVVFGVLIVIFMILQVYLKENATVRPRLIANRTIACAMLYAFCIGGAMVTLIYFLSLWFQAILSVSAVRSGINILPMLMSLVIAAMATGGAVTKTGWYNPFVLACPVFLAVGAGLMTTLNPDTASAKWIGYQILIGIGLGMGMQQGNVAVQAVLPKRDIPVGMALMFFSQSLGGAIFLCVGQSVFTNKLSDDIATVQGVEAGFVLMTGATELKNSVPAAAYGQVLLAYNAAVVRVFIVVLSLAAFSIVPALGFKWVNVKRLKEGGEQKKAGDTASNEKESDNPTGSNEAGK